MKIAFILPSLRQTGPIFVVHNLCKNLIQLGVAVEVFYFDKIYELSFNCPTHHITLNKPIDFDSFDIIHSHCFRPDKYLIKWKNKIKKAKIISTLHQDTYVSFRFDHNIAKSFLFTAYWFYIQKQFDGVISISNQLKNKYDKYLSYKVTTIYNGCNINMTNNINKTIITQINDLKNKGYFLLGTCAYVVKRKGLEQIINILKQKKEYAFIIIGNGPNIKNLKQLVSDKQLDERVLFIPHIDNPYLYLNDVDIYVMPSYSEGFGLAMIEAALVHKPIVCSNIPSFHEIFTENEASFFELDNKESLIEAIEKVQLNISIYSSLAFNKANNMFTDSIMSLNHLEYYKKILNNKP